MNLNNSSDELDITLSDSKDKDLIENSEGGLNETEDKFDHFCSGSKIKSRSESLKQTPSSSVTYGNSYRSEVIAKTTLSKELTENKNLNDTYDMIKESCTLAEEQNKEIRAENKYLSDSCVLKANMLAEKEKNEKVFEEKLKQADLSTLKAIEDLKKQIAEQEPKIKAWRRSSEKTKSADPNSPLVNDEAVNKFYKRHFDKSELTRGNYQQYLKALQAETEQLEEKSKLLEQEIDFNLKI